MENEEVIKNTLITGDREQINILLERWRNIRDPNEIRRINTILVELARQHNISLENIHIRETITIANTGNVPIENNRNVYETMAIAVVFIGLSDIIVNNWSTIRDFLFYMGTKAIDVTLEHTTMMVRASILLNNPATRTQAINILEETTAEIIGRGA